MKEIWKPIKGYEGLYEVSNTGQVRSLYSKHKSSLGPTYRVLKPFMTNQPVVDLYHESRKKATRSVAKLVASAFIPNPNNYKFVLHANGDIWDNSADNLYWSFNSSKTGSASPVKILCIQNNTIYRSMSERELSLPRTSIYQYFKFNRKHVHGYTFKKV